MLAYRQFFYLPPTLPGLLIWFLFLAIMVQAAGTNRAPTTTRLASDHSIPNGRSLAGQYERDGRKREAAAIYEEIARTNTAARKVLSHRLVAIYTEAGETNKALTWAREVMRDNPDPPAYLAGVHARLGQWREAREILAHEIDGNTNASRSVTLRWQLAEVYKTVGDSTNARKVLNEAAAVARETPLETASLQRLNASKQKK